MLWLLRRRRPVGRGSELCTATGVCLMLGCGASVRRAQVLIHDGRFIPNREGVDLTASFSLLPSSPSKPPKRTPQGELHFQKSMADHPPARTCVR